MTTMQIFILLCGLAAVLYGLITSRQILSLSTGNEKMVEIANAIQDLKVAFDQGLLPNSLTDEKYFNIKRMNNINLR